ncbi:MAG TPA: glycoside hydrolase family 3 N-terminal domain-containing protein [Ktedonobacterales bacterium]|nr:glycoside hydrolase family 3 N-terminal domain-containing protein [Ktedonobacterales bacterium]
MAQGRSDEETAADSGVLVKDDQRTPPAFPAFAAYRDADQAAPVGQVATRVRALRARGRRALRHNGRRARRLYPAILLVVVSCLLALLACDLSPSFLPLLASRPNGSESSLPSGQQVATPGVFPPSKPFSLADLQAQTVNYYLSRMSLDEKIGQMMMFETSAQSWNSDMDAMVRQMHAGAIIIYKKNMVGPGQLTTFISAAQAHTTIPMFVTMDEEGGNVDRLGDMKFNKPLPSASWLGGTGKPQVAYDAGAQAARNLQSYGINTDLAPVVDVRVTPDQIEGPRLFGNDPYTVQKYATQFLLGLQQNSVIGCLKHWPGIGDANQDPHLTLPTIDRTRDQLEATEFAPFRAMLKDNPGMIMVTHVILSAIDPTMPSSLSPAVVQGVLRGELGYNGVVITDNLWMKGISDKYSLGQAAVLAIIAGDDLLEGAWNPYELRVMINAVKSAVASGQIRVSRIDQSVKRLLTLKVKYGILPYHVNNRPHLPAGVQGAASGGAGIADLPRRPATLG